MAGLVSHRAHVRSTDARFLGCPFRYYLERRLCLTRAWETGPLSAGWWFHVLMQELDPQDVLRRRISEISAAIMALREAGADISDEEAAQYIQQETETLDVVSLWHRVVSGLPVQGIGTFKDIQGHPWRVLGREISLVASHVLAEHLLDSACTDPARISYLRAPRPEPPYLIMRADALVYHEPTRTVWIDDYKSTSLSRVARAQTCTVEFQTLMGLVLLHACLVAIRDTWGLDRATVGGVRHIIIGKPPMPSRADNALQMWRARGVRRKVEGTATPVPDGTWRIVLNPLEGSSEQPREMTVSGEDVAIQELHQATGKKPEPVYGETFDKERYLARVSDWYHARGQYLANEVEFSTDPPVVISYTYPSLLAGTAIHDWATVATTLAKWAWTNNPTPGSYPRTEQGMYDRYSALPSIYADFFTAPVHTWPKLVLQKRLVAWPRDTLQDHAPPPGNPLGWLLTEPERPLPRVFRKK